MAKFKFDSISETKGSMRFPAIAECVFSGTWKRTWFFIENHTDLAKLVSEFENSENGLCINYITGYNDNDDANDDDNLLTLVIRFLDDSKEKEIFIRVSPMSFKADFAYDICRYLKKVLDIKNMIDTLDKPIASLSKS